MSWPPNRLQGRIVAITGAGRGIGLAIARLLAGAGCRLAICGRDAVRLTTASRELGELGAEVYADSVDVSQEDEVERWFAQIDQKLGPVQILINNAGAFDGGHFPTVSREAWDRVIDSCLTGAFLCSREAFRRMERAGEGRILNIGSISAQRPREGSAPYAAAKFGLWGLTQAIAIDGRAHGIVCSCLHPGNVLVERRQDSGLESDRESMMDSLTIAEAALAMLNLPPDVNFLEGIVLPRDQAYLSRG